MKVLDCYKKITKNAPIVGENDSIEKVIDAMLADKKSRSVYVVDSKGELSGIIVVKEALDFLAPRFFGGQSAKLRGLLATRARHIMKAPVFVSPKTPLEEALELLIESRLEELPVIENGKIVGDLNCLEVIDAMRQKK